MTSGGMPMRHGLDAIYEALSRAIRDDPLRSSTGRWRGRSTVWRWTLEG